MVIITLTLLVHLLCVSAFNYNEVRYRPGNTGFTQTQTHFNSLNIIKNILTLEN
jgi:hypothetical protein